MFIMLLCFLAFVFVSFSYTDKLLVRQHRSVGFSLMKTIEKISSRLRHNRKKYTACEKGATNTFLILFLLNDERSSIDCTVIYV